MKRITIICLFLLVFCIGCAGHTWIQKESDEMIQKKEYCKKATIDKARLTQQEASEAYWNDILSLPEYRDYYEKCLKRSGYIKQR